MWGAKYTEKDSEQKLDGLGHKAAKCAMGISDNLQDKYTYNPVPVSIRVGSYKEWRVEAKQETEQEKCRFNGKLEYAQYAGERERRQETLLKNKRSL